MSLARQAYFRGSIVPYAEAKIGVLTHGLNYGTSVFGGVRGYWNDDRQQLYLFRPHDHFRRFLNSARLMLMEIDQTEENLTDLTIELIRADQHRCNIYIRPLAYKADESIGVRLHNLRTEFSIVAFPFERYLENETDVSAAFSSWRRVDDNVIPARGKISGAYANSAFAKTDAVLAGYDEALVLTQDGHVSEASAMNIFMVKDGALITPPITDNILEGITRATVIELAREEIGMPVIERSIDRSEIYLCQELMLTGTAAQVIAVTRVDHRPIGQGKMGPVTERIRQLYCDAVYGLLPKFSHWNVAVYP